MTGARRTRFFRRKRILITGGIGFIGSNLARRLVALGAHVTLVDSMIPDYGGNLFNIRGIERKIRVNFSDVRDVHALDFLVRDHDLLFNLAGQVSHLDSMHDPYTDLAINTTSQLSILEVCRRRNPGIKVIFASTRQIYGKPQYLPVNEEHPLQPTDVNGIHKIASEWYHLLYWRVYGIRTVCLRLTNTYGPRLLMKHSRQGFLGWFVRQLIERKPIVIYGNGQQKRDLNYIDDVVDAFLIAASDDHLNGEVFNLGNVPPISLEEIAKSLIRVNRGGRYRLMPFPRELKKIDIGDYYASYAKFKSATGWEPRVTYEAGFRAMLSYYKKYHRYYWT